MSNLMAAEGEVEFNLLQRFGGKGDEAAENAGANDMGEIELSLGLSLGGCFGAESKGKKLIRASSISTLSMFDMEMDHEAVAPLTRACSIPVETEEGSRKRIEMQSLKRLEAKSKRSEKRAAAGTAKDRKEESFDEDSNKDEVGGCGQFVVGNNKMNGDCGGGGGGGGEIGKWFGVRPNSQGSIGSQGSSSSVFSDFESRPMQGVERSGLGNCTEVKIPSMIPSDTMTCKTHAHTKLARDQGNSPSNKKNRTSNKSNGVREMERNMEEMPCVSTKFDGPYGRRIEGFLYKYRKGEEVRIVCVCHGSFLTPAEFVKHAGGGDVAHPLRHIVVNPAPSALL